MPLPLFDVCTSIVSGRIASAQESDRRSAKGSPSMKQRIIDDLKQWDAITDHRTGTHGDRATANWLAEEIRHAGLKPVFEEMPFHRRVLHECAVRVADKRITGVPLFDG